MMPGTTVCPLRSTTLVFGPRVGGASPTATMRPFLIEHVLAIVFLASDRASYINGAILQATGGQIALSA